MHPRIAIAKFLIKLGGLIQGAAPAVMRPRDLIEFSRRHYLRPDNVRGWSDEPLVNSGLSSLEQSLLAKIEVKKGPLLLLGVGGGREAIPLAKLGFTVTGIDFIPGMVERAKENAEKNSVQIIGSVQEITNLDLPQHDFTVAWLSAAMYSCIPTRKKRLAMLKRIHGALAPGGCFVLGFLWNPQADRSRRMVLLKKILGWLSLGSTQYERGDMLRFNLEFIHVFTDLDALKEEILRGGFEHIEIQADAENEFAGAIARKPR
jgi:SAM-dependent methyltransferase